MLIVAGRGGDGWRGRAVMLEAVGAILVLLGLWLWLVEFGNAFALPIVAAGVLCVAAAALS